MQPRRWGLPYERGCYGCNAEVRSVVVTAVLTVFFASMTAFALSRLKFRGSNIVLLLIILGIMIPSQVLIVPIFQELNAMNLLNTYWSVIFPQVPAGLATVQGSYGQRYADIQAGAMLAALPLIILYLIFQRQIVEGVTGSGLKG